jgi:hypothetical protein
MTPIPVPSGPWKVISLDIVGPINFPNGTKMFFLIAVDLFSKFLITYYLSKQPVASKIIEIYLLEIAWRASEPEVVISDRAKNIIGDEFFTFLQKRGVRLSPTMSYHHQANPVERYVKTLKPF